MNSLENMIKLLKKKIEYLNSIYEKTETQYDVILKEDMEKLFGLIKEKQVSIDSIDKLDEVFLDQYTVFKNDNQVENISELDSQKYPQIKELKDNIETINKLLNDIKEQEMKNNVELNKRFQSVKNKLKSVKKGKKMVKGYDSYKNLAGSAFIDVNK